MMNRCVRLAVVSAAIMSVGVPAYAGATSTYKQVQDKLRAIKKNAPTAAPSAEKVVNSQTWYQRTWNTWRDYLAMPAQPHYLPARKREGIGAHFSHTWARNAFNESGHKADPSALAFGQQSFPVKDLFVASNLLANDEAKAVRDVTQNNELPTNSRHFLCLLANQPLAFEAHYSEQQVAFAYDRTFLNDRIAFSIDVPVIRKEHRLAFDKNAELTRTNRSALVEVSSLNSPLLRSAMGEAKMPQSPTFYEKFNDLEHFVTKVLDESGLSLKKRQEAVGLGDIKAQVLYRSPLRYVDDAQFGARVSFGTGRTRRNVAVWEPELAERSGATNIQLQARLKWHRGKYANPFMNVSLGYSLPVSCARRVPFELSYDASQPGARMMQVMPRTIPFSDVIKLSHIGFNHRAENNVRDVASTVQKMTLHQGLDFDMTLGNTLENCFNRPVFMTVAYSLNMAQGHRISGLNKDHAFADHVMTRNTFTMSTVFMTHVGYRLNNDCAIEGSMVYRLTGRNTLASITCRGGLSLRF